MANKEYIVHEDWRRFYDAESGNPCFINVRDDSSDVAAIYGVASTGHGGEVTTLAMKSGLLIEGLRNGCNWYATELGALVEAKNDI